MIYRIYFFLFVFIFCQASNAQNVIVKDYSQLPIKATRTISFTTDEGSYMDVQISPDGKTILFDLLGDIFLVPANGGKAKQITHGLAMNHSPAWSPDGKSIAFSSDVSGDRRLHVCDIDGSNDRVFDSNSLPPDDLINESPQWLPNSKSILFGTFLYDLEGNRSNIKESFKVDAQIIGFSNDCNFFYTQSYSIERYDRCSLQKTVIKALKSNLERGLQVVNAKVSEDEHWLTYIERSGNGMGTGKLIAYNIAEADERVLAQIAEGYPNYLISPQYSISADSKNVFIGYGGKIHRIELRTGRDEIIPFNATVKADMGPLNYHTFRVSQDSLRVHYTRSANTNTEKTQLVFSALNRVYIMDIPNGKPMVLVPQPEGQFSPCFSPDGKWIAYVSWNDTSGGQIWRVSSDGSRSEQLTQQAAWYQNLNWSPDGNQIVAMKGDLENATYYGGPNQGQIITISLSGAKKRIIADSIPFYNFPVFFSADGASVIYITQKGDLKFVKKSLSTSDLTDLVSIKGNTNYNQLIVSPDQRFVVWSKNESLFLLPISTQNLPLVVDDEKLQSCSIRFSEGGFDAHWEQGGKILSWSCGNKYYQVDPNRIVDAANKLSRSSNNTGITQLSNLIKCKVQPDRTVTINLVTPVNHAKGTAVLKNARIITMRDDKVIENGTIVIRNGRIVSMDEANKTKIPVGALIIDVSGKIIMPGIIDLHLHYAFPEGDILPQQSWQHLIKLAYGVTTARDPASGPDGYVYSDLLQAGALIGPRLYPSGEPIRDYDINSFEDGQRIVNNHVLRNGTFMKQYLLDTRMRREWLLMASAKTGLNMTNEGYHHPLEYLGLIKDGSSGEEHSAAWGNVYGDVIKFLALSGTFLTPTLQERGDEERNGAYFRNQYFKSIDSKMKLFTPSQSIHNKLSKYSSKDSLQSFFKGDASVYARVLHQGGKIGMGSHGNYQGIGAHFEIWALQMGGMSNMEALRCATLTGAEAIGIQKDVGSIEVGKIADLIILDKNPLEDIHNTTSIRYVMKDGILYDANTLDEIWPEKKKCPEWRMKEVKASQN